MFQVYKNAIRIPINTTIYKKKNSEFTLVYKHGVEQGANQWMTSQSSNFEIQSAFPYKERRHAFFKLSFTPLQSTCRCHHMKLPLVVKLVTEFSTLLTRHTVQN